MKNTYYIIILISLFYIACKKNSVIDDSQYDPMKLQWKYSYLTIGFGAHAPPKVILDSLVLFIGDANLTCLKISNGNVKWISHIDDKVPLQSKMLLIDDSYIYGTHIEDLRAWDKASGEEQWRLELPEDRGGLFAQYNSLLSDRIYVAGASNVKSITLFNGINFEFDIKGAVRSAIVSGLKLFCGHGWYNSNLQQDNGMLTCLNAQTGDSLWSYFTTAGSFLRMAPIIEDNIVYCGTTAGYNCKFFAFNAETGAILWKSENIMTFYAIIIDDFIFGNEGGAVYALNKINGELIWRTELNIGHGESELTYINGHIYHIHGNGCFVLIPETGEIVYHFYAEDGTSFIRLSTGAGKVFLQSGAHLYCYEPYKPE